MVADKTFFSFGTYESHEEEHDLEAPAQGGDAGNVAVPDGRHCHHEEVDALPVGQLLAVEEVVPGVARVLQLLVEGRQERMDSGGKEWREMEAESE